jgi:hypothetical protein
MSSVHLFVVCEIQGYIHKLYQGFKLFSNIMKLFGLTVQTVHPSINLDVVSN